MTQCALKQIILIPFANSFHLFIADDSVRINARELSLIWFAYLVPNVPKGVHFLDESGI